MNTKKGDRYRALEDVKVRGIVTFGAPFSSGFSGIFPRGCTCIVEMDPPAWADGVHLRPDEYDRFEREFVSEHDRRAEEYDSYAMAVSFDELMRSFEKIAG